MNLRNYMDKILKKFITDCRVSWLVGLFIAFICTHVTASNLAGYYENEAQTVSLTINNNGTYLMLSSTKCIKKFKNIYFLYAGRILTLNDSIVYLKLIEYGFLTDGKNCTDYPISTYEVPIDIRLKGNHDIRYKRLSPDDKFTFYIHNNHIIEAKLPKSTSGRAFPTSFIYIPQNIPPFGRGLLLIKNNSLIAIESERTNRMFVDSMEPIYPIQTRMGNRFSFCGGESILFIQPEDK